MPSLADILQPPKRRPPNTAPAAPKAPRQSKLAKEHSISAAQESEIREAFALFSKPDPDASSKAKNPPQVIPTSAIRRALTALGAPPASAAELAELTEAVDPDGEGHARYENFVAIAALKLHARTDEARADEVAAAFLLFTRGGSERISLQTLKRVARELKENVDEQLLKDMITEANGGAGVGAGVSMEEFEEVMRRAGVFR